MLDGDQVAYSKAVQRRTGKTFHVATRVLPERVRHATYALYAFFRVADEVVDDADGTPPEEQRARLERLRRAALGEVEAEEPAVAAFSAVREECGIAEADVNVFIDAMKADIEKSRYATYEELEAYMDGSAAAVGRMMTAVMDPDDEARALPHATALGEAFQMTNFLRDVREDVLERDRIYLPAETLREHGATESQVERCEFDESVADAVRAEMARTERLYERGVAGIKYLPEDCQFAVLLAAVLYVDHHRLIRARGYDVLSATPQLRFRRKLWLLAKTRWKWLWNDDPEDVFRDVAVGFGGGRRPHGDVAERPTLQ